MDDVQRLLIERACERLAAQYCHFVDHGEAARIAELFTEDGVWTAGGNAVTGQPAIRATFERRQRNVGRISRHVCCNMLVDVIDEDHAQGVVYLTLYRHDGAPGRSTAPSSAPDAVGEYRDAFVRGPDGWRFHRRDAIVSFAARAE